MKKLIILLTMFFTVSHVKAAHFKTDSAKPTQELKQELEGLYESEIKGRKINYIYIEGHTDSRGSIEYNEALSESRALSTFLELQKLGPELQELKKENIKIVGMGESDLLTTGLTLLDHAKNRRVVVTVKSDKGESKTVISECKPVVIEKRVYKKNTIKGFVGYGPRDLESASANRVDLDNQPFVGVGYQRHLNEEFSLEVIGTTNESLMLGGGFSF